MKIVVCMKQTPARDSVLRTSADEAGLDLSQTEFETNEPDSYALEEALRLKDEHSAEVVAVTAGASNNTTAIRDRLLWLGHRGSPSCCWPRPLLPPRLRRNARP